MQGAIQMLRDEMHAAKESFDKMLAARPSLTRDERLAEWKRLLIELKPLSERLARAEARAEKQRERRIKALYDYGYGAVVQT